jgi:hypothetical protein
MDKSITSYWLKVVASVFFGELALFSQETSVLQTYFLLIYMGSS